VQAQQRRSLGGGDRTLHNLGNALLFNAIIAQIYPQNPLVGMNQFANAFAANRSVLVAT